MDWVLAMLIGLLYGSGLFLMMRRTLVQLVIGLGLLGVMELICLFLLQGDMVVVQRRFLTRVKRRLRLFQPTRFPSPNSNGDCD